MYFVHILHPNLASLPPGLQYTCSHYYHERAAANYLDAECRPLVHENYCGYICQHSNVPDYGKQNDFLSLPEEV